MRLLSHFLAVLALLSLAACSSGPKAPDWKSVV